MKFAHLHKILLSLGVLAVLLAGGLAVNQVFAGQPERATEQISPLHPTFPLLDADGGNVLTSAQPVSAVTTCGQCHDTEFITSHSFHADLGLSEQVPAGSTASGRAWDTSPGLYGKWNPLTYRYLTPQGDTLTDLDTAEWVVFNAGRISGGGAAAQVGLEMNCFLCHLNQPDNTARVAAIQSGESEWASTATLLQTGIVDAAGETYTWNPAAFDAQGNLAAEYITIQDPANTNCAQCHGLVHTDPEAALTLVGCSLDNWQTATTGQVISAQKISVSGMNLQDKAELTMAWDIHAERGLKCTDCHFSLNNPAYYNPDPADAPGHLEFDPRRLEIGEYLEKPDHNLARGQSAQFTVAEELKGTMRRCESCHNVESHADWLPYVDRHMQELACETCHIPQLYAPAVQSYDWTVADLNGDPTSLCRGVEGQAGGLTDLVTGFQPVLLLRSNIDGGKLLAPYNLVTSWYWVYASPDGERPVPQAAVQAAFLNGGNFAPEVLSAFDLDANGLLSDSELRLDNDEKVALIAGRLVDQGFASPRIAGEIQPYSINHNVVGGEQAVSECAACHASDSRLAAPLALADYLPGGVLPEFVPDSNTLISTGLNQVGNALVYAPQTEDHGLYVFGHNRANWVDWFGAFFFVAVLVGVAGHGGLRAYNAMRHPVHKVKTKKVYMYAVYERFWHWLQTFAIVLLLFTGLIIHRPDIFGWLSFRYMVTVHNVLAAILVINAFLSLFYHLASGEIKQFIPRPYGFFDQAILQAKFYLQGIFKGSAHPFEKNPERKLNPLQQVTYFGILNVLLPLQIITGALLWAAQQFPDLVNLFGGLPLLAPFHSLVAWTFGAFIVGHVYLTTTGHEPLAGIQAMINGWEDTEVHETEETVTAAEPVLGETPAVEGEAPQTAPAD